MYITLEYIMTKTKYSQPSGYKQLQHTGFSSPLFWHFSKIAQGTCKENALRGHYYFLAGIRLTVQLKAFPKTRYI